MARNPDTSLTIDTHHHLLPDFFWQATENANVPVGGLAPLQWSKEASVSFMDDAGIDIAIVSVSTPGVHIGDSVKARALARRCNEFSAELIHSRPDRFAGFACRPLPDVDASLEELSYSLDVMGFIPGGDQRGTAAETFRRIYWGTALSASDPVLHMLRDVAGLNQVLFGTDFPYLRRDLAVKSKQRILQSSELNESERRAILGGNAARLFPRFNSTIRGT